MHDRVNHHHRDALMSRRVRGRDRGQALVEFALVIPIFFLMLAAVFDISLALYAQMTVANAAQEAARVAAVDPDPTTIFAVAQARAKAVATGLVAANLTVGSPACVAIVSTSACDFSTIGGSQRGDAVRITLSYGYRPIFPFLLGATINLTATSQMTLQ
jgi:Flp pilus assembly protein TadG